MLLSGDEVSHTQQGNNNCYCQDNELTWLNWEFTEEQQDLLLFVQTVIKTRKENPVFQRRRFFHGKSLRGNVTPEISWLEPSGREMSDEAWNNPHVRCLGVHLCGGKVDVNEYGERSSPTHLDAVQRRSRQRDSLYTAHLASGEPWEWLFDTSVLKEEGKPQLSSAYALKPCSVAVLRSPVTKQSVEVQEKPEEVLDKAPSDQDIDIVTA